MIIAILYPGAMGSSLAASIHACSPQITLLTHLSGRSESTRARALAAGLKDTSLLEIVQQARIIISILPPSESLTLAKQIIHLHEPSRHEHQPIFLDLNAVSPTTSLELARLFQSVDPAIPFIDGCVIGGPAREGYDPKIYLSAGEGEEEKMKWVEGMLGGGGKGVEGGRGLRIVTMPGAGVGGASALKMSYAGITKGTTGLITTMILSANAHSKTTAQYLAEELASSQPAFLERGIKSVPEMLSKAYRWVGEMEEISEFISNPTGTSPSPAPTAEAAAAAEARSMADIFMGMAKTYERIAADYAEGGVGGDVGVLKEWVEKGSEVLAGTKK